jgi:hypothetical protein
MNLDTTGQKVSFWFLTKTNKNREGRTLFALSVSGSLEWSPEIGCFLTRNSVTTCILVKHEDDTEVAVAKPGHRNESL